MVFVGTKGSPSPSPPAPALYTELGLRWRSVEPQGVFSTSSVGKWHTQRYMYMHGFEIARLLACCHVRAAFLGATDKRRACPTRFDVHIRDPGRDCVTTVTQAHADGSNEVQVGNPWITPSNPPKAPPYPRPVPARRLRQAV